MNAAAWVYVAASALLALGASRWAWKRRTRVHGKHAGRPGAAYDQRHPDTEWLRALRSGNSRAVRRLTRLTTERGWTLSGPPRPRTRRKRRIFLER